MRLNKKHPWVHPYLIFFLSHSWYLWIENIFKTLFEIVSALARAMSERVKTVKSEFLLKPTVLRRGDCPFCPRFNLFTQNFPPTLENGPSSKIVPGPFFSPIFSFPPEIGPFVAVPGPFFRTRPFPCCRPDLVVQDNKSQQQLRPTGFEDKAMPDAEQSLNI